MVIYSKEEKVIIIPEGSCTNVGSHSRCEREVQIAYTSGWSGGYEQGLEDCSGSTCNLTTGMLDLHNGDDGRWIVYPDEYDGFDQFRVYDRGYGEGKFQEGYASGTTRQKSLLSSTAFTQNGQYTRDNGWSAVTVNVPNAALLEDRVRQLTNADGSTILIRPNVGYDGMSQITLIDVSYGQSKYQSGYTAGLEAGGGCHLVPDVWSITTGWGGGRTTFYPPSTACGFSEFTVYDNGYGRNQYNNGVNAGFASGFTSASTREISLYFHFNIGEGNFVYKDTSNIIINSNSGTQLTYLELTGNMDVYEAKFLTTENSATTIELWLDYAYPDKQFSPVVVDQFTNIKAYDLYDVPIITQNREFVEETETRIKYKYTFTVDTTPFYDRASYEAGLAACQQQIHNTIYVENEVAGHNIRGFVPGSQRDLMINGSACPYSYTIDGDGVFGFDAQFNIEAAVQLVVPQSFAFTVDCTDRWADQNGPNITSLAVFGNLINNYTVVKTPTTAINPDSLGIIYTITINQ